MTLPEIINSFTEGQDQEFHKKLYPVVLDLLMNNTSFLYQALYRLDVKEDKVKKAFEDNPEAELAAERISVLIVDRQKEKLIWRKKYSL